MRCVRAEGSPDRRPRDRCPTLWLHQRLKRRRNFSTTRPYLPVICSSGESIQNSRMFPGGIFFTNPCKTTESARAFVNSLIDSMPGLVGESCYQAHLDPEGTTTKCCISVIHRRCPSASRPTPKQTVDARKITSGKTVLPTAIRWTRNCGERSHSAVVGERSPCVWCLRLPGLLAARSKNATEISPAQQRRGWRGQTRYQCNYVVERYQVCENIQVVE